MNDAAGGSQQSGDRLKSKGSSLKTKDVRLQTPDSGVALEPLPASFIIQPAALLDDCWNTIGVAGDQSCGELARQVHCHNCPVYAAAAGQFLDRPLPAHYRREWTAHYAREKQIAMPAKTSAVLFRIGTEWLALPTAAFQEIASGQSQVSSLKSKDFRLQTSDFRLHSLPHRRRGVVLGIVNVRGELLICASLGKLLGLGAEDRSPRAEVRSPTSRLRPPLPGVGVFNRMLVAEWQGQRIGFPVEEVHGVHRFHTADLREPPATVARSGVNCALGVFPWRHYTVGFLDPESLFAALNRNLS